MKNKFFKLSQMVLVGERPVRELKNEEMDAVQGGSYWHGSEGSWFTGGGGLGSLPSNPSTPTGSSPFMGNVIYHGSEQRIVTSNGSSVSTGNSNGVST